MSVKNPSGIQIGIPGLSTNGQPVTMYISNEVAGKYHFRINGEDIHFDKNLLKMALQGLEPVTGAKHGGTL